MKITPNDSYFLEALRVSLPPTQGSAPCIIYFPYILIKAGIKNAVRKVWAALYLDTHRPPTVEEIMCVLGAPYIPNPPVELPQRTCKVILCNLAGQLKQARAFIRRLHTLRRFVDDPNLKRLGNGNSGGPIRDINELEYCLDIDLRITTLNIDTKTPRSYPTKEAVILAQWAQQHSHLLESLVQ